MKCSDCNYCVCTHCLPEAQCPKGHELVSCPAKGGNCDGCKTWVPRQDPVMKCMICNWYLCDTCKPQAPIWSVSPKSSRKRLDRGASRPRLSKGLTAGSLPFVSESSQANLGKSPSGREGSNRSLSPKTPPSPSGCSPKTMDSTGSMNVNFSMREVDGRPSVATTDFDSAPGSAEGQHAEGQEARRSWTAAARHSFRGTKPEGKSIREEGRSISEPPKLVTMLTLEDNWERSGAGVAEKDHVVAMYEERPRPPPKPGRRRPPSPPKPPARKAFSVGEEVESLYRNGCWYPGKVEAILGPNSYEIRWSDGDAHDKVKGSELMRRAEVFDEGEHVEGLFKDGKWYRATIECAQGAPISYVMAWADDDQRDKIKPKRYIRRPKGKAGILRPCADAVTDSVGSKPRRNSFPDMRAVASQAESDAPLPAFAPSMSAKDTYFFHQHSGKLAQKDGPLAHSYSNLGSDHDEDGASSIHGPATTTCGQPPELLPGQVDNADADMGDAANALA